MYDSRMSDYLQYLASTPEPWVPHAIPKLDDVIWGEAFAQANTHGKVNIAHAWLWELNLMLGRKNYHRPSPGLISILQEHARYLRMFGSIVQPDVAKDWFVTGSPENLSYLISPKETKPVLTQAFKHLWADSYFERIEGIYMLEALLYPYFGQNRPIPSGAFKLLHDLVWDTLCENMPSHHQALSIGYQLIVRLDSEFTYKGPDKRYINDPNALAWHQFSHVGGERTLLTEYEANELRAVILTRPLKERFYAMVYLVYSLNQPLLSSDYIELGKVIPDEDTIYNWDNLRQATVADILRMWLPELASGIELAQATDTYLHELGHYFSDKGFDVAPSMLPVAEYC